MLTCGPYELTSVVTGTFRLDGGAMFGVVPKVLWAPRMDVDDANRVLLAMRTVVAIDRSGGRVVLVDTGAGTKWAPEQGDRFAIRHDAGAIARALASRGLTPNDVTDVVVTHLHFDHNGGVTEWVDADRRETRLCFPRARHWLHARHWAHAHAPTLKDRASFLPEDFQALEGSDAVQFVGDPAPRGPFDGLEWLVAEGHSPAQLLPIFRGADRRILFTGDMVPTTRHLPLPWVMAYDLRPMTTIDEKREAYRRCLEDGWLLALPHDPEVGFIELGGTPDRPTIARTWVE
jgi:glyoxylase-like metal-dependent hydrolase (beta-lactamase superfamily II)